MRKGGDISSRKEQVFIGAFEVSKAYILELIVFTSNFSFGPFTLVALEGPRCSLCKGNISLERLDF